MNYKRRNMEALKLAYSIEYSRKNLPNHGMTASIPQPISLESIFEIAAKLVEFTEEV